MKFIKKLILDGQIPYFRQLRIILLILSFSPILFYFFSVLHFGKFGELGWQCLVAIMLIRPLADVFPGIGLLRTLTILRKEVGIFAGLLIAMHSYMFFAQKGQNIFTSIFKPTYWGVGNSITWGILGFIVLIPLLLTSNKKAMKILRGNWKRIQKLAYPLFFFSAIHIAIIKRGEISEVILPVIVVIILWLMAQFKIKIPLFIQNNKKTDE